MRFDFRRVRMPLGFAGLRNSSAEPHLRELYPLWTGIAAARDSKPAHLRRAWRAEPTAIAAGSPTCQTKRAADLSSARRLERSEAKSQPARQEERRSRTAGAPLAP